MQPRSSAPIFGAPTRRIARGRLSASKFRFVSSDGVSCKRWRVDRKSSIGARAVRLAAALSCFALIACDPIVTIAGANFPSWMICLAVGAIIAAIVRPLLIVSRLEPGLGPLPIFYSSLIAMFAMTIWLIFFNRA